MKLEEAIELERKDFERRLAVRLTKGHDYAKDFDCLTNFKVMAELAAVLKKYGYEVDVTKSHGVALWHLLHKIIRLLNLWNKDVEPKNESLDDTLAIDMPNYVDLMKECYYDFKKEAKP